VFQDEDNKEVELKLYGSLSNGLALESSDMDLCLNGVNCFGDKDVEKTKLGQYFYDAINSEFP
jgi:DNA polymerase sigma